MKTVIFTKHATERLKQRSNVQKYAVQMFNKAKLLYKSKNATYYQNGRFRFITIEKENEIKVVTVIRD